MFLPAFSSGVGAPPTPPELGEATLCADRSVILIPGTTILLRYQTQDGKVTGLAVLPKGSPEKPDTIRMTLSSPYVGGYSIGPRKTSVTNHLTIASGTTQPIEIKCQIVRSRIGLPERIRLTDKYGKIQWPFKDGVNEVDVIEIKFKPPQPSAPLVKP